MKPFGCFLLLVATAPALLSASPRAMTVGQLQDLLTGLDKARKSDEQIANELKQIELTEELSPASISSIVPLIHGPLSTEQMYVLEARSAMLAPPDSELPKAAPPNAANQQALLAKAVDYAAKTSPLLPRLTGSRLVARFQDGVETIQSFVGTQVKTQNDSNPIFNQPQHYVRLMNVHSDTVELDNGIDKPIRNDTTPWGRNGYVNSMLPFLPLDLLTSEAVSSGKPKFLRWETITGHRTAVFSFAVGKKNSHYAINYCCFPEVSTVGGGLFGGHGGTVTAPTPGAGAGLGGLSANTASHPSGNGNLAYVADWNPFHANSGYHGELFLDPNSGAVLRAIVEAEFKPSDLVHYEDIRVDFAPIRIGSNILYVPVRSFTIAEVVPNGDSLVTKFGVRHQYVTQDYKGYHSTDAEYQVVTLPAENGNTAMPSASTVLGGRSSSALNREGEDDQPPPGGFPSIESISRPAGPLSITASGDSIQRPPDDEIKALLVKAAQNANDYWDSLPNFTCRKVSERFAGSSDSKKWEHIDTLTGRIDYFNHQEELVPESENDRDQGPNSSATISDSGIFGNVIRGIFRPTAKAEISWFESDALNSGSVQVFKYHVAKENSKLFLRAGDNQVIPVGYHGMIYIDGATGEVRRITQISEDVPTHYPIYQTLISTDYDHVSIGGQQYLLPIGAQIVLRRSHKGKLELNQIGFSDFHRFRSTAKILSGISASMP